MSQEIFGRAVDKDAIVLDTRFNGGGNLVEPLTVFLSGKVYARDVPRGRQVGEEPFQRWTKPSIASRAWMQARPKSSRCVFSPA